MRSTNEKRTQRASAQKIHELSKLNELKILLPYNCVNLDRQIIFIYPRTINQL